MAEGDGAQRFTISETNPNDSIGGGGCLCSEVRHEDRGGPYAVFPFTEQVSGLSPHIVICAPCVRSVCAGLGDEDREQVFLGEPVPELDGDAELLSITQVPERHENPVAEGDYPILDAPDPDDEIAI
jgi:hypothetical protein